ncbi:MAG: hypothetical protein K2I70_06275 [Bacilli bacterium]|nr:hypothetical protein [Bacilli bacterium]
MKDFSDKDLVKVIRARKITTTLLKLSISLPITLELCFIGLFVLGKVGNNDFYGATTAALWLFRVFDDFKDKNRKKNKEFLNNLAKDIEAKIGKKHWRVGSLNDITIVPENVQIGYDLEAINLVPIFKKGHYIIIDGNYPVVILTQHKNDEGKSHIQIMDDDEVLYELEKMDKKVTQDLGESKILSYGKIDMMGDDNAKNY